MATQNSQHTLHAPAASASAWQETMKDKSKISMKGLFLRVDLSSPGVPRAGCGVPEREPIAAMSATKLGVQAKGEEARVEGTQPGCHVLRNFSPKDKPLRLK